jgi:hypothetical protein
VSYIGTSVSLTLLSSVHRFVRSMTPLSSVAEPEPDPFSGARPRILTRYGSSSGRTLVFSMGRFYKMASTFLMHFLFVLATDRKIELIVEIMMPKSEYGEIASFISYVEVEKTSA